MTPVEIYTNGKFEGETPKGRGGLIIYSNPEHFI